MRAESPRAMPGDSADAQQRITELENRVQEQAERIEKLERKQDGRVGNETIVWMLKRVEEIVLGRDGDSSGIEVEEMTTAGRYVQMPLGERAEAIGASELRATLIFENWTEWAREGPYGDEFISTAQSKPAPLRMLLREADPTVDVQAGEDLAWQQVYRAMRALHRLTDGAFQYDEDHTPPDNTNDGKCHALTIGKPAEMPVLRQ